MKPLFGYPVSKYWLRPCWLLKIAKCNIFGRPISKITITSMCLLIEIRHTVGIDNQLLVIYVFLKVLQFCEMAEHVSYLLNCFVLQLEMVENDYVVEKKEAAKEFEVCNEILIFSSCFLFDIFIWENNI